MGPCEPRVGFTPRLIRSDSGAAMVEFTLLITFLLTLAFGVFEFGRFMYGHHLVTAGLRDGARYLARVGDPSDAANQTAAKNIAVFGNMAGDTPTSPARVSYWLTSHVTIPNPLPTVPNTIDAGTGLQIYRGTDDVTIVRLTAAVPFPDLGMLDFIGVGSLTINASHEERHIGD